MSVEWNYATGTWDGDRVPSCSFLSIPSPLYVFGYGSLLWKPGPLLETLPMYRCSCLGWKRLFAQKSCDHRGTPNYPGLVLTLVSDKFIEERGLFGDSLSNSDCCGSVWEISEDVAEKLLDYLDYRERGGYERQIICVKLHENSRSHKKDDTVQALVYAGAVTNPNFFLPSNLCLEEYEKFVSNIISVARGPSGPNREYLFNLIHFLQRNNIVDIHLQKIASRVSLLVNYELTSQLFQPSNKANLWNRLRGCGSNEFRQLLPAEASQVEIQMACNLMPFFPYITENMDVCELYCGGGTTGFLLRNGNLILFGKTYPCMASCFPSNPDLFATTSFFPIVIANVRMANLGHESALIYFNNDILVSLGEKDSSLPDWILSQCQFEGVQSSICNDNSLPVFELFSVGCPVSPKPIAKLAQGLHHSMVLFQDGSIHGWGSNRWGQLSDLTHPWESDGAFLVDIACGSRHTIALDSIGTVWSWGSNKYGALGLVDQDESFRTAVPSRVIVPSAMQDVMWRKIHCGWSHVIIEGVDSTGKLLFVAWGRNDMGQYPLDSQISYPHHDINGRPASIPRQLVCPVGDHTLDLVATGSEFTIACDAIGGLWGCGWNEHGNLGIGHQDHDNNSENICCHHWTKIVDDCGNHQQLSCIGNHYLACGGGHVIFL